MHMNMAGVSSSLISWFVVLMIIDHNQDMHPTWSEIGLSWVMSTPLLHTPYILIHVYLHRVPPES